MGSSQAHGCPLLLLTLAFLLSHVRLSHAGVVYNMKWTLQGKAYGGPKQTIMKDGDLAVFRWKGENHNLYEFSGPGTYNQCLFRKYPPNGPALTPLVKTTNDGYYLVRWPGKGKVRYFASGVGAKLLKGGECATAKMKTVVVGA